MSMNPKAALMGEHALVAPALSAPARRMLLEQIDQGERGVDALTEMTGLTTSSATAPRRAGDQPPRRQIGALPAK